MAFVKLLLQYYTIILKNSEVFKNSMKEILPESQQDSNRFDSPGKHTKINVFREI